MIKMHDIQALVDRSEYVKRIFKFFRFSEQKVDLSATLSTDPYAGTTVFCFLAVHPEGRDFLIQLLRKYPDLFQQVNLSAALTMGPDAGITAFLWLAENPEGQDFLTQLLEKYPDLFQQVNLNAAPTTGPYAGKTAFWFLARHPKGQAFLMKSPELLLNVRSLDINNKSLWEKLSISNHGFEKTLILLGADICSAPSTERDRLTILQRDLFQTLDKVISDHWCNNPTEAAIKAAFYQFIQNHPELASLEPIFDKLVAQRINNNILLEKENIFESMAKDSARQWLLNNIELIKGMELLAKESFMSVKQIVFRCLQEENQKPNFPKHIEKELEAEIVRRIASHPLKEMDEYKVRKAIQEAVFQWSYDPKHYFDTNAFFGKGYRLNVSHSKEKHSKDDLNATRAKRLEFFEQRQGISSEAELPKSELMEKQARK